MIQPENDYERMLLNAVEIGFINTTKTLLSLNPVNSSDDRYFDYHLVIRALENRRTDLVKVLIKEGFRVYKKSKTYQEGTVLHAAIQSGDKDLIATVLEKGAVLDILTANKENKTAFHLATDTNQSSIIELFLPHLDVKPFDAKGFPHYIIQKKTKEFSPLHHAVHFKCKRTVKLLLENGADVTQRDNKEMTALHVAAKEAFLSAVSLLVQYGADIASQDFQNQTPVHWAFEKKNYEIVDLLLSVPNVAHSNPSDSKGVSLFHIACARNNVDIVKSFIDNGVCLDCVTTNFNFDEKNDDADWSSYSPLHFAVHHNRAKIVQLLLDCGANVRVKTSYGITPLHIVCPYTLEMFTDFIEYTVNDLSSREKMKQQLHSHTDVAKVNEKHRNFEGFDGKIDWSSNRIEHMKIINLLFRNESDVMCTDDFGDTPLYRAFRIVDIDDYELQSTIKKNLGFSKAISARIVKSLSKELYKRRKLILDHFLKFNVNFDKCCRHGSILHSIPLTRDKESKEMMELFIEKGADVNCINPTDNSSLLLTVSDTPFLISCGIIELLVNKGARLSSGTTALHNLASIRTEKAGAGRCMMEVCPIDQFAPAVSALIRAGADVNGRNSAGLTALHVACEGRYHRFASILLEHGADINAENDHGKSVCCYLYDSYYDSIRGRYRRIDSVGKVVNVLHSHTLKMKEIGWPITEKTLSSLSKCEKMICLSSELLNGRQKGRLIEKYAAEVQLLRDTRIYDGCTLLDVIFKSENALSRSMRNPLFEAVTKSKTFEKKYPNYGYLIKLKYQTGVDRAELLPVANCVLSNLAGMHLPDACSENICKYFNNVELKESTEMLRELLDFKVKNSVDARLTSRRRIKRQKNH